MVWFITIFISIIIVTFTIFYILKDIMNLRIKYTTHYEQINDIIVFKAKQSYELFRIRDLSVYINNDTRMTQEEFILYAKSYRDFFKLFCGDIIYSLMCKMYGGEKQLKIYLTIIFHNYIIDDKLVKASEALYSRLLKEGE